MLDYVFSFIQNFGQNPKSIEQYGRLSPNPLLCSIKPVQDNNEIEYIDGRIPKGLQIIWDTFSEIRLFEDMQYGQWGLVILSPLKCKHLTDSEQKIRPLDFQKEDLLIGEFLGDLDKILLTRNKENFGFIYIAHPLDKRDEWSFVSESLEDFLFQFISHNGEKFWER